jgi:iron complex transport system substrate-binding protein
VGKEWKGEGMRPSCLCTALLAGALLAAPAASTGPATPSRIISLVPAATEMLFALGAGPRVAAVSSFDTFPPEVTGLPRVGALLDPDLERILALRPDLVVVYSTQTELRGQLERAGIPQFPYTHARLADVAVTIRELGARVGEREAGARLAASIENAVERIRARVAGRARPRTLLVISREAGALRGIFASGGFGFLHDMLEAAGGTNVYADVPRESLQASSEMILARRPDVIVEIRGSPVPDAIRKTERQAWQALSSVPAVRTGRLHVIGDARAVVPGPRVAEGTELLARTLHPEAFRTQP